jgi:hypothetical protein
MHRLVERILSNSVQGQALRNPRAIGRITSSMCEGAAANVCEARRYVLHPAHTALLRESTWLSEVSCLPALRQLQISWRQDWNQRE